MASLTGTIFKEKFLTALKENETLNVTCQEIALEIQSGRAKFYEIVEELQSVITDKNVDTRIQGICALSTILSYFPKDFLSTTELCSITSFYFDRLKDHSSIISTILKAILAIVQMKNLPKDAPERLFRILFEHVHCQNQTVSDRHTIYLIFVTLLESRTEQLKVMGPDFVYGVITTIEGEKDPKNLLLLFDVLPHFMKEFPLGHLAEEMFEIISCYFPVDYNPVI